VLQGEFTEEGNTVTVRETFKRRWFDSTITVPVDTTAAPVGPSSGGPTRDPARPFPLLEGGNGGFRAMRP
jgi:hypothetical protein